MTFEQRKNLISGLFKDNTISIEGNLNHYKLESGGRLHLDYIHPLIQVRILIQHSSIKFEGSKFNTWLYKYDGADLDSKIEELDTLYTQQHYDKLLSHGRKLKLENLLT